MAAGGWMAGLAGPAVRQRHGELQADDVYLTTLR
jgi:hypothetical protein